MNIHRKNTDPT